MGQIRKEVFQMTRSNHVPLDHLERLAYEAGAEIEAGDGKAYTVVAGVQYVADLPDEVTC